MSSPEKDITAMITIMGMWASEMMVSSSWSWLQLWIMLHGSFRHESVNWDDEFCNSSLDSCHIIHSCISIHVSSSSFFLMSSWGWRLDDSKEVLRRKWLLHSFTQHHVMHDFFAFNHFRWAPQWWASSSSLHLIFTSFASPSFSSLVAWIIDQSWRRWWSEWLL